MRSNDSLRYLATRDVENVPESGSLVVESVDGFELGRLDGFMVDPDRGELRYYVVTQIDERRMQLGFVPFVPGCLDTEQGVLRLLDRAVAEPLQ
jgi:hypothetical protein